MMGGLLSIASSKPKKQVRCSKCKQIGHNKRTCKFSVNERRVAYYENNFKNDENNFKNEMKKPKTIIDLTQDEIEVIGISDAKESVFLDMECPICFEQIEKSKSISTICGHIFHETCLQICLRDWDKLCPMCRTEQF